MTDSNELFDAKFLERLRLLFFKLRKRGQLQRKGAQSTPASGFTREFKDHRHYTPGDDYRTIDWRLFARLDKTFIRVFEEIQEYHVHILLDRSNSMADPHGDKRIMELRVSLALAYMALLSQHRVSIFSLGDSLRRETTPLKGQGNVHQLLKQLPKIEFGGTTDLIGSLKQFRPSRDRRGIVFVISDLFGRSPETATEALLQATRWPAETHVIHVLNPAEMRPTLEGEIRLVDVETKEIRRIWMTRREQRRYAEAFDRFIDDLKRTCTQRQINYFPWITDQSFEDSFLSLLSRGNVLAGTG